MKAFLLARVSTDEQKDALPGQVYRLTEYASKQRYTFELFELRESAYSDERKDFAEVVRKIVASPDFAVVVFDKIDRFSRDASSPEVRTLNKLCKQGKIELHFPSDNLIIHKDSPSPDKLRLGMGVVVAQYYSDAISDNVKRRIEQKLRDGEWIGPAPFGYTNTVKPDGKKWVSLDTYKALAIKEAFTLYASGTSSILEIGKKWRSNYKITVSNSKVATILKDPFYYGEMRVNGKLHPHNYKTIITEDLFDKARLVREGHAVEPKRWAGLPYPYRGLIRCSICSCRITFEIKKRKYIYGHCTQSKGKHGASYVNENVLTKIFASLFKQVKLPDDVYEDISQKLRVEHEQAKASYDDKVRAIDNEIKKYEIRLERMYDDYLDGKINEELHDKKAKEVKKSVKTLKTRQKNIELFEESEYGTKIHLLKLARDAPKLFEKANYEQKRSLINKVLSNLRLEDDLLRSEYKDPFDLIAKCNKTENWYPGQDSNLRHAG